MARAPATVEAALAALADAEVRTYGAVADATDEDALREALDGYVERLGVPAVLVYNAAIIQWDELGELTAGQHLDAWAVNVVGAITAAAHLHCHAWRTRAAARSCSRAACRRRSPGC